MHNSDHVQVQSSSSCFPGELVSFIHPRELSGLLQFENLFELAVITMCVNPQEPGAKDIETVRSYMLEYLADGSRSYSEPYFTVSEVIYIYIYIYDSFVDDI